MQTLKTESRVDRNTLLLLVLSQKIGNRRVLLSFDPLRTHAEITSACKTTPQQGSIRSKPGQRSVYISHQEPAWDFKIVLPMFRYPPKTEDKGTLRVHN